MSDEREMVVFPPVAILSNDELLGERSVEAGFVWKMGEVKYDPKRNRQLVSLGLAPFVRITDILKFEAHFPGVMMRGNNGTSVKVQCQAVTRRALIRNRKITAAELRVMILNALRQTRNRPVTVVVETVVREQVWKIDGKEYTDILEAAEAQRDVFREQGFDDDMIENLVGKLIQA